MISSVFLFVVCFSTGIDWCSDFVADTGSIFALWSVMAGIQHSCSIPLSAWYSCNQYGGLKNAKDNLLFISTNRILTICWGILYLCTPIWTFFLMQTDFSKLISLVNSVFPALLGIFTWWFQKWYPARKAAGK